jgi:hypothetical protein
MSARIVSVFPRSFVLNKVDDMNDVLIDEYEECGQDDVLQFECWYHSVMDDVASLIRANGYDKVMLDIMTAVNRMENKV